MHYSIKLLALLWVLVPLSSSAQAPRPIKISIGNEATAIPFTRFITTPIHPTIQAGTEFLYRSKKHHELYQTLNIGYIFHSHLYQGIYINTGLGYDLLIGSSFKIKTALEVGYLRTYTTQDEYRFKDGEYINVPDAGNGRIMPSISLGVGYRLQKDRAQSSEIFVLYKPWVEYPYSPGFIPLMTHTNLELGYKFYINNSK